MIRNKKGFTLIELLVVIAIIGVLASVVIAAMNSARKKSRDARRISDLNSIKTALEMYYDANQSYPINQGALAGALTPECIAKLPADPTLSTAYAYAAMGCKIGPIVPCTGYHLGAVLEDGTSPVLLGDADRAVGDYKATAGAGAFDGSSSALGTCSDAPGTPRTADRAGGENELCYDIIQ